MDIIAHLFCSGRHRNHLVPYLSGSTAREPHEESRNPVVPPSEGPYLLSLNFYGDLMGLAAPFLPGYKLR
jgi:hypothetical protein